MRRSGTPHHLFRVSRHAGVWRLIHNSAFFADYANEADAAAAAHAAADKETACGHTVEIVSPEGAAPEPALCPAAHRDE